jgi:hypothetical protein
LEAKSPPDLFRSVQEKRELRFLLLKRLFEKAGGSSQEIVNFDDIAKEEGVSEDDTSDFIYYLMDENLIRAETVNYGVSITDYGIEEVEERMEAQANGEQTSQPDQKSGSDHSDEVTLSRKLKVFLCHSSRNKPAVRNLYTRLSADGIQAWLDEKNILVGQDWKLEIKKAVCSSDAIIVCISADAMNNKGYFHSEIKLVMDEADMQPEGHIFTIPILLEECEIPERFKHIHCLKYYDNPDDGYEGLIRALNRRAEEIMGYKEKPTRIEQSEEELSEDEQEAAIAKVSEWLKNRNILMSGKKGEWIRFKDIAADTNLKIAVIKECIEYAAFLQHLKVGMTHPGSVYIIPSFGT